MDQSGEWCFCQATDYLWHTQTQVRDLIIPPPKQAQLLLTHALTKGIHTVTRRVGIGNPSRTDVTSTI